MNNTMAQSIVFIAIGYSYISQSKYLANLSTSRMFYGWPFQDTSTLTTMK